MRESVNPGNIPNTPMWEKVLGLFGFILLCTGFIYLGWVAIHERQLPPDIQVTIKEINELDKGYLVQVEVINSGAQSVGSLQIQAKLRHGSESEISTAEVDYVPSNSRNSAGLFFTKDPRSGELTLRALGYQKP